MANFTFSELSPDLILDAIESLGIRVDSGLLALNSYENRVYQFITESRQRLVVKFYRPNRWTQAQLLEEHAFALELAKHEVPLAAPLLIDGESLHGFRGYQFALYPSVGGRQFEVDNLEQLEWMGRFIGRIHQIAQHKPFIHRPAFSAEAYLQQPSQSLQNSRLIPAHLHDAFFTILDMVVNQATQLYTPTNTIRLHGDCHPGNILWHEGPTFVDLDDCRTGPAIQDLWMMLSGDHHNRQLQVETLIEAYEEFCEFDLTELALIEPLRAMRMVHYMAWLDKRWDDPAFPRAFSWFASDKYWENQILALKEQYAALQEPALRLSSQF